VRLSGRVVDEAHQPVHGARVQLEPLRRTARSDRPTVTSSADGTFTFERLAEQRYSVSATKDDFFAWHVLVDPERPTGLVVLELQRGATLIVHATRDHAPVVDAQVLSESGIRVATDATGTATLRGLRPGGHHMWLVAKGCMTELFSVSFPTGANEVEERFITLKPASHVEGVVLDWKGNPVPGARVQPVERDSRRRGADARADSAGRFSFDVAAAKYCLFAWSASGTVSREVHFECDGRTPTRDLVIRIYPRPIHTIRRIVDVLKRYMGTRAPTRIAGVVVDDTGTPIPGAAVARVLPDARNCTSELGRTDAHGRFDADDLEPGEHQLVVQLAGSSTRHRDEKTRVRTGDLNVRLVVPTRRTTITGRAVLEGSPLPYVGVSLTETGVFGGSPVGLETSDGHFTLRDVEPGTWRVALRGAGTRIKIVDGISIARDATVSLGELVLERGQRIAGVVRDASGAPVAGARVHVGHWTRIPGHDRPRVEQEHHGSYRTTSDADGAYLFDGIDAHAAPHSRPHIWASHTKAASTIRALSPTDDTIDLMVVATGHVDGVIADMRGGRPAVKAIRADEPLAARMAFPDKTGAFQFDELPVGDYVISVDVGTLEQELSRSVTVIAGQTSTVKLAMETSSVDLTILVQAGLGKSLVIEPVTDGAGVGGRVRGIQVTGTEDRCTFHFVRPGRYRVSTDGAAWSEITIESAPAEHTIDLR
jgi:protocatechuate 3,4-dioxygenase beta subunit